MEEIQSSAEAYKSSSSSSSPANTLPSTSYFFLRKPGSGPQLRPVSFEDSPEWEDDVEADIRTEEEGRDSATTGVSPQLSKQNSISMVSPQFVNTSQPKNVGGASLAWRDLTITIRGKRKYSDKVIKSSTGYALPGTLTVIMGPAKSGKSTLLRALAGLLPSSTKVYGEVFVNGRNSRLEYGTYGYVERADELIELLTVREMLYYSALLQLPDLIPCKKADIVEEVILAMSLEDSPKFPTTPLISHPIDFIPRKKKASLAEDAIFAMSLEDYADIRIGGNCYQKGLSSGERRRVSIARELIASPQVVFIDEPLYHLDSVSALLMMVTLKKLASTGCTIIFTMYQSSTEVFGLFDRICLISNGKALFFGETLACLQHFANAGFPCPVMQSPSDHFLRAINTDFDRIIAMCKNWQDDQGDFSSVNMDTAVAIRTLETTYKASTEAAAVEAMVSKLTEKVRVAAIFFFIAFTSLMSIAGFPAHIKETKVIYFLLGMRPDFSLFMYFMLNFFMCLLINESLLMVIASILPEVFKGILTMVFLQGIMMLVAGYFRLRDDLPRPVWKYPLSYLAFHTYAIEGLLENEYTGISFAVGQVRSISGDQALRDSYNISSSRSAKWLNLLILAVIAVGYWVILFLFLHYDVRSRALSCRYTKRSK